MPRSERQNYICGNPCLLVSPHFAKFLLFPHSATDWALEAINEKICQTNDYCQKLKGKGS